MSTTRIATQVDPKEHWATNSVLRPTIDQYQLPFSYFHSVFEWIDLTSGQ